MALPYLHAQSCEDVSTATVTLSQRELTQAEKDETCGTTFESEVAFYRVTPGALPGIFTVGYTESTGKYTLVRFSKGNLQYLPASAEGDSVWRFAEHQYDYIGANNKHVNAARNHTIVKINDIDTPADNLWFDLFGYGTSGKAPLSATTPETHPLTACTDYMLYLSGSLTGSNSGYDWGVYNKIVMGGDQAGQWRTLTNAEWAYLINTRRASNHETLLYSNGRIKISNESEIYVNGLILFPDGFEDIQDPDHVGTTLVTARGVQAYTANSFSLTQWAALEKVGVVFLPAAGYRDGTTVSGVNANGFYWSSTGGGSYNVYACRFNTGMVNPSGFGGSGGSKNRCSSVRLVQNFTK